MPSSPASDDVPERAGEEAAAETLTEAEDQPAKAPQRGLEEELAQIEDRYKRALADLDNYRKRSAREIDRRVAERSDRITRDWLEAVDSVERAMRMQPESELAAGLRAVLEQMEGILERQGVERVGAEGDRFDPELHEAVGVRETDEVPDRTILALSRSGYSLDGRVLRPAEVVVSRRAEGDQDREGG